MLVSEILAIKGTVLYTVAPNKTLGEAVGTMNELDVGSLVVVDQGRMSGMLTFREVLKAVGRAGSKWGEVPIAQVMIANPMQADPSMELDELRRAMIDHHQRYIPVMDEGVLLGVISFHDVAKAVLEEQSFENKMLKSYIRDWPADADAGA
jgi:CBS domain-containing protein